MTTLVARHKVLDIVGDLALCGFDIAGHLVAYRSGHALNVALAGRLVDAAADVVDAADGHDVILPARGFIPARRVIQRLRRRGGLRRAMP